MDNQTIIVCDETGKPTGEYIPKEVGHTGQGKRHLAITVLLSNNEGQVLLQKRKHKIFDDIWDLTGATHPLHQDDGNDEDLEQATLRCLKREYGLENIKVRNLGFFNYFAQYGDLCENECCAMLVGNYIGEVILNPEAGYEYKWMEKQQFLEDIKNNSQQYSPWAVEGVKILAQTGF